MTQITKQQAFDKALDGVTAQRFPSMAGGMCKYREELEGGAVRHCGVGWLLDDETARQWDSDMLGIGGLFTADCSSDPRLTSLARRNAEKAIDQSPLSHLGYEFLDDLQSAHDQAAIRYYDEVDEGEGDVESFQAQFAMSMWLVAQLHGLEVEA